MKIFRNKCSRRDSCVEPRRVFGESCVVRLVSEAPSGIERPSGPAAEPSGLSCAFHRCPTELGSSHLEHAIECPARFRSLLIVHDRFGRGFFEHGVGTGLGRDVRATLGDPRVPVGEAGSFVSRIDPRNLSVGRQRRTVHRPELDGLVGVKRTDPSGVLSADAGILGHRQSSRVCLKCTAFENFPQ
ncbi:MAG: hypothetical protein AAB473_01285 [Patescibacteria group bacterium]